MGDSFDQRSNRAAGADLANVDAISPDWLLRFALPSLDTARLLWQSGAMTDAARPSAPQPAPSAHPGCGVCDLLQQPGALHQDELFQLRPADPPYGVAGWLMLVARRHVAGPAFFDDREAAALGPQLRRFSRALLEASGALRIYVAALGESHPHFHMHLVPRRERMDLDAKGWAVFDLQRAAAAGEIAVDEAEVRRVLERLRGLL
jgi:diadenosine tetraphosphate (Ap4A) HIT family hydrolase